MSTAAAAIVADGLTKQFGDFVAVDHVSFSVDTGEIFGFLGPNGAGKTTTIKMLTGLQRPGSGRAIVAGVDPVREPAALRSRIGYMSQKFSLYGDLTVSENIELFAGLYDVRGDLLRERRAWTLRMAGSKGRRTASPRTCRSGGSSGSRWAVRSCISRRSCSWTSRRPAWTPSHGGRSGT